MNERIKQLAEQAGADVVVTSAWTAIYLKGCSNQTIFIERFAELIRADEREQISHTYLKLTMEAVLRERDACGKLCEDLTQQSLFKQTWAEGTYDCAAAIRQRGEK